MYIRCEKCRNWSHGDALGLEEARLGEVIYYRCCRCRRKARCPHSDDYHPKRSEAEPISQENAAGILSSAEAVGAAGDNSSYASFGRVENPVEETVDAYSPVDTESFVPESNEDINFVDGSSHSTHPFDKEEIKQVMKDVRPHDACFSWHTPGNGSCRPLDSVDGFPPPAPTVETNLDKNQTVILQRAFDSFRVIAAETGSLYERLRERDLLTNDEIMGTLDMLQEIALHRMQDIACCQVDDIIYPENNRCTMQTPPPLPGHLMTRVDLGLQHQMHNELCYQAIDLEGVYFIQEIWALYFSNINGYVLPFQQKMISHRCIAPSDGFEATKLLCRCCLPTRIFLTLDDLRNSS